MNYITTGPISVLFSTMWCVWRLRVEFRLAMPYVIALLLDNAIWAMNGREDVELRLETVEPSLPAFLSA